MMNIRHASSVELEQPGRVSGESEILRSWEAEGESGDDVGGKVEDPLFGGGSAGDWFES